MTLRFSRVSSLLPVGAVLLAASPSWAATWQNGTYGGNLTMTYYIPDTVRESPALVVSLHYCSGNASSAQGWFQSFADDYGFMIISPAAPGNCWDASPGRSGDREQIAKMVDWAIQNHNVNPARVFAAGASSGACMSETMLASYPDKFAAASVLAGVPVGFWSSGNNCNVCSQQVAPTETPQAWGDRVRNAGPPGYTGSRGRIQLWHAAQDQYLGSGNLAIEVSQWTNVLGVTGSGTEEANTPRQGWTRTSYADSTGTVVVQSNWWGSSPPSSHDLTSNISPPLWDEVVEFFELAQEDPDPGTGGTGAGGGSGTGGAATGGVAMGGVMNTGGVSTGGLGPTGGRRATGGFSGTTGGFPGTTGGRGATGGFPGTTGGRGATGGSPGTTGGRGATGGSPGTTGGVSTGGAGVGGASGGVMGGTGGAVSTGGVPTGGAFTGGVPASGGAGVTGGMGTMPGGGADDEGGCTCRVGTDREYRGALLTALLAGLGMAFRRRRPISSK